MLMAAQGIQAGNRIIYDTICHCMCVAVYVSLSYVTAHVTVYVHTCVIVYVSPLM